MKMIINGTFSNFNTVKEIKVPEEVIKNAISMEEYFKQLEAQFEKNLKKKQNKLDKSGTSSGMSLFRFLLRFF